MQSLCGIPTAHEGKNPRIHRGLIVDVPKGTSIRGLREDFALCGRSGCGPTAALSRDYAGYPRPTRRKIRRFYVDVYVDESSKIESRLCALRKVNLWTKKTAGCNQLPRVSYWSQSGTLARLSIFNRAMDRKGPWWHEAGSESWVKLGSFDLAIPFFRVGVHCLRELGWMLQQQSPPCARQAQPVHM